MAARRQCDDTDREAIVECGQQPRQPGTAKALSGDLAQKFANPCGELRRFVERRQRADLPGESQLPITGQQAFQRCRHLST